MKTCRTCGLSKPVAEFYRHRRSADGRDDHYRVVVAERAKSPEKTRARRAVEKALEAGRIVRPDACSACGRLGRVEGHHDDYARQLDVRWLCSRCHHAEHRRREQAA